MATEALTELFTIFINDFSAQTLWATLKPLLLFIIGITIYSVFIFRFYRFVAKRDIFALDLHKYNIWEHRFLKSIADKVIYIAKYVFIFPLLVFSWFLVLAVMLAFLSKSIIIQNVLLTSIALVGAVRIAAYYDENLSNDLAKMLPFALLGVFIIDINLFSITSSVDLIKQIPSQWIILVYYLLLIIILEFALRMLYEFVDMIKSHRKPKDEEIVGLNPEESKTI